MFSKIGKNVMGMISVSRQKNIKTRKSLADMNKNNGQVNRLILQTILKTRDMIIILIMQR
jgi:hypothetical protein